MDEIYLAIAKNIITSSKPREAKINAWSLYPTPSIIDIFANQNSFNQLTDFEVKELIIEMNNRVAKALDIPASEVSFKQIDLDKDAFNVGIGRTYTNGAIEIGFVGRDNFEKLPKFRQDWLGLEYLNTIIHESRHAYQNYMATQYFSGKPVKSLMACIAQDIFVEIASSAKGIDFYFDYDSSLCEYDAVGFTYDTLSKYAKMSDYEDKLVSYLNKECASILADSKDKRDIVKSNLKNHINNLNFFKKNFQSKEGKHYSAVFDKIDLEYVGELLQKEFTKHRESLLEFLNDKQKSFEENNSPYAEKLGEFIDKQDLYKAYYGVLFIEQEQTKNMGEDYEIVK